MFTQYIYWFFILLSSSCVSKNTYIGLESNARLIGLTSVVVVVVVVVGGVFYNGRYKTSLLAIGRLRTSCIVTQTIAVRLYAATGCAPTA